MKGILRAAACVPRLYLADPMKNAEAHLAMLERVKEAGAGLAVFPELSLTGYTCGDLFFQQTLQEESVRALLWLAERCPEGVTAVVGAPLRANDGTGLYNCAVLLTRGLLLGAVAKTFLPNYNEFYEKRWFRSASDLRDGAAVRIGGTELPLARHQVFESADGVRLGVELCEDLWTPLPPSTLLSLAGAEVIVNLSASNELIAKREYRRELVCQQSARCLCGYVYVSAGNG